MLKLKDGYTVFIRDPQYGDRDDYNALIEAGELAPEEYKR